MHTRCKKCGKSMLVLDECRHCGYTENMAIIFERTCLLPLGQVSPESTAKHTKPVPLRIADPLAETVKLLSGSDVAIKIIRYLMGREGRRATLIDIARDVYNARTKPKTKEKNVRTQIDRMVIRLEEKGAPLRINKDRGTICILDVASM
jgi:hypothetical protein